LQQLIIFRAPQEYDTAIASDEINRQLSLVADLRVRPEADVNFQQIIATDPYG